MLPAGGELCSTRINCSLEHWAVLGTVWDLNELLSARTSDILEAKCTNAFWSYLRSIEEWARDSSGVKSTYCPCRGLKLSHQHRHGGPQMPVILDLILSSALHWFLHPCSVHTPAQAHTYTWKRIKRGKNNQNSDVELVWIGRVRCGYREEGSGRQVIKGEMSPEMGNLWLFAVGEDFITDWIPRP